MTTRTSPEAKGENEFSNVHEFETQRQNEILEGVNKIIQAALFARTIGTLGRICLGVAEEITQSKFGYIGELNSEGLEEIAVSNSGWDACKFIDAGGQSSHLGSFELHGIYGRAVSYTHLTLPTTPYV